MIYNINQRKYLARQPRWAVGWFERLRGMIGRRFVDGELDAMVFERCGMVHSCWMSIPLDLLFLDVDRRVVAVRCDFRPWRWPVGCRRAVTVVELPAGVIAATRTRVGDRLNLNSTLDGETIEKLQEKSMLKAEISPFSNGAE